MAAAHLLILAMPYFVFRGLLPYLMHTAPLVVVVAVLLVALGTVWFRVNGLASWRAYLVGVATVAIPIGVFLVLFSWVMDVNPSGRAQSPESESFLRWLLVLSWKTRLAIIAGGLAPLGALVTLAAIGGTLGTVWRRGTIVASR